MRKKRNEKKREKRREREKKREERKEEKEKKGKRAKSEEISCVCKYLLLGAYIYIYLTSPTYR